MVSDRRSIFLYDQVCFFIGKMFTTSTKIHTLHAKNKLLTLYFHYVRIGLSQTLWMNRSLAGNKMISGRLDTNIFINDSIVRTVRKVR